MHVTGILSRVTFAVSHSRLGPAPDVSAELDESEEKRIDDEEATRKVSE